MSTTSSNTAVQHDDDKSSDHHSPEPSRLRRAWDLFVALVKDQWFLIGVAVVTIIASQVQVPAAQQATKQVVATYLTVSIIFFITGCTLDTSILIANYARWKHHLFIQLQCFLVVSALAFGVVSLCATNPDFMDPWLLIGLIFLGCGPTTMASNVMFTRKSHGNAPLTVVETTIGNFIGPFITPVLIRMYLSCGAWYTRVVPQQSGGYAAIYSRVFMQLGLSIYLPMAVGQVVRGIVPCRFIDKVFVQWKASKIGSMCLLVLLWQTFDHAFSTGAFTAVKKDNLIFIVFIMIVNYAVWLGICVALSVPWMDRKDTVSAAMCVPAKTLALSVPLSFLLFEGITPLQEAKIQVPLVLFQIMQLGMASFSTLAFRRWVDRGEELKRLGKDVEEGTRSDSVVEETIDQTGDKGAALAKEAPA